MKRTVCILSSGIWILASGFSHAILDTNNNGVSDFWERDFNNGSLFDEFFDPQGDSDADGWTNAQEAAAGTNPFDPNPPDGLIRPVTEHVPALIEEENGVPVVKTPEAVKVTWPTLTGKQYTMYFSPDLTQESWLPVGSPFIAQGGVSEYGFQELSVADKRFWRVAVEDIDEDSDGLSDHEESIIGTSPDLAETFTGIPDAWLARYYEDVTGFDPYWDDDEDELINFDEYLYNTNPLEPDTDGDGASDYAEIQQGGNPNNAADGGNPPADPVVDVAFLVGGDYASWRMEILPKGPRDNRAALRLASPYPGETETKTFKLWKNNSYEITMYRTDGVEDWYCWEARVDGKPDVAAFDVAEGYYQLGERNDQAHFFTVAGHWLIDNRQGLLTSHLHSYEQDVATPLKAQLIPVAIEDNIEATGVDVVSNSVAPDVPGYQDKLWIMAPIAGAPPPADYSNAMKFNIPLNPAAALDMESDHATPDPATIPLDGGKPTVVWRGSGANETNENTTTFEIGEHNDEVDLPIGVLTMKHRTVKLAVYPVRCKAGNRPVPMPDRAVLENWLNHVFAYQLNAWFEVEYKPQTDYDYDPDNDGIAPFWTKLLPMSQEANYQDEGKDIRVFVIDWVSLRELGPLDEDLYGIASGNPPFAVVNAGLPEMPARPPQQVIETIAHEIGHVLIGEGHPNEGGGRAPLPGTDHSKRLMSTLAVRSAGAKLLVKNEWDEAEAWLKDNPDRREQQQGGN